MATRKRVVKICHCSVCDLQKPMDEFWDSTNPFHLNGKVTVCKSCAKEIFTHYLKQTGTMQSAVYLTLCFINLPFIEKCFNMMETKIRNREEKTGVQKPDQDFVGQYINAMSISRKTTDEWHDWSATDVSLDSIGSIKKSQEAIKIEYERFKLDWGDQDVEAYNFLEYRWDFYTTDASLSPSQETLYRQLCLVELAKRKKEEQGESTKDEQNMMLNLMKTLKIDNFSENKDKSLTEQMIFDQIVMVEKEMPCDRYNDQTKYRDVEKIGKYMEDLVYRPLLNTLTGHRDFSIKPKEEYNLEE